MRSWPTIKNGVWHRRSLTASGPTSGIRWTKKPSHNSTRLCGCWKRPREEDLDGFQIPETEMKQRVISVRPAAYGRPGRGRTNRSDKKYYDQKFMQMQIEGISRYFQSVEAINKTTTTAGHNPTDYG